MKNLSVEHKKGKDISKKIRGVNEIMNLKLKEVKKHEDGKKSMKKENDEVNCYGASQWYVNLISFGHRRAIGMVS